MIQDTPQQTVEPILSKLRLSESATVGTKQNHEITVAAILIGWNVVANHCLSEANRSEADDRPADALVLTEIQKIYCTNWPNAEILRILRSIYGGEPQEWWETEDLRALLDLVLRSAIESVFAFHADASD